MMDRLECRAARVSWFGDHPGSEFQPEQIFQHDGRQRLAQPSHSAEYREHRDRKMGLSATRHEALNMHSGHCWHRMNLLCRFRKV